jgi:dihydrofolate reductase
MRRIILNIATSLDGFIEGPNGEYDWCFTDGDYGMEAFLQGTDAIFFGRKSYELVAASFSRMWNDKQHYVFSNSLREVTPGVVLVNGDVKNRVQSIKEERGKDIWLFGGASLTSSLMELKLVDEVMVAIHPILLGAGKTLIRSANRIPLQLVETIPYPSGLVQNRYKVLADAGG